MNRKTEKADKKDRSAKEFRTILKGLWHKSRHILLYGVLMAILIFALKWLQWKYIIVDYSLDIYIGLIAVFFTVFGGWAATKLVNRKVHKVVVEKEIYIPKPDEFTINDVELEKLNLSSREYEVLQHLAKGRRNAEIAQELFLSVSTIKTHVSSLLDKMDVKNRTHAVTKAKKLNIVQ